MHWLPGTRMAPPGARAQGAVALHILGWLRARARVSRSKFRKIRAPQCQSAVKMGDRTVSLSTVACCTAGFLRWHAYDRKIIYASERAHVRANTGNFARQRFSLHGVDLTKFDGGGARDVEDHPSAPQVATCTTRVRGRLRRAAAWYYLLYCTMYHCMTVCLSLIHI